jgi:hypothetical protein
MADEEVDWGVDEISEVNGVGAGVGITTADEKKVPTGPRQSAEASLSRHH